MNWSILNFSVCMALLCSSASAAVIERDWKTPGDGLLTLDTVNKREWLDLSQTLLSDQFPGSGANEIEIREARYQYVVGQTAQGGLFEGFHVAKSPQVVALAQSSGIDTSSQSYVINAPGTSVLCDLLGFTFEATNGNKFSIGLLDEIVQVTPFRRTSGDFLLLDGFGTQAGLQIGSGHFQYPTPPGVYLYRTVPEPNHLGVLSIGLIGQMIRVRFRPKLSAKVRSSH